MRRVTVRDCGKSFWLSCASATVLAASIAGPAFANPQGGEVVTGAASIAGEGTGHVTVTQSSDRAVINWQSFSIGAGERTEFRQPSSTSIAVNRVIGLDPSTIMGSLSANGQVVLINRNGVLFGRGATVDVGGLVVTSHDIDDTAFMAGGNIRFEDGGVRGASVVNEGTITIGEAGVAAFVAPHVRNSGVIQADLGRVALGSGSGFTLDLYGDGLIKFAAGDEIVETLSDGNGGTLGALVENDGEISAAGGRVMLSAAAAREVVNQSVNIGGVVRAASVSRSNGVITLSGSGRVAVETGALVSASGASGGGRIEIDAGSFSTDGLILAEGSGTQGDGGTIDIRADAANLGGRVSASGRSGGTIAVDAQGLLSLAEEVEAVGAGGAGGEISYRAGRIMETSTGITDASGLTHGGTITVMADSQIATSGDYVADGLDGRGGRIDITAADLRLLSAGLTARGGAEGGHVRVGGAFQGGKTPDPSQPYHDSFVGRWENAGSLASAQATFVNDTTLIDVSSHGGQGGTAVVWSDALTTFLGGVDARGATGGGAVEISSAEDLRRADLGNVDVGAGGHLLLDPKNIIIGTAAQISDWSYAGIMGVSNRSVGVITLDRNDRFGASVALNAAGDRLAVGAYGDRGAGNAVNNAGAVHLFSFTDTSFSGGALEATIGKGYTGGNNVDVTALEAGNWFGSSVALNAAGDRLAVGASNDSGAGNAVSGAGAVRLFSFTDTSFSGGTLEATLGAGYAGGKDVDVTALEASDSFGVSVALNAAGDRLAVGAIWDDGAGNAVFNSGAVYLFSFTDTSFSGGALGATLGQGYTGGKDVDVAALEAWDGFGASVALNAAGDRLAVGANADDGAGNAANASGAVHLFSFTDTNFTGGTLEASIGAGYTGGKTVDVTALEANDRFGMSVALNAAGDRLAVGASGDAGAGNAVGRSGAVYLFSFTDGTFSGGALEATIGAGYTGGKNVDVTALEGGDEFGNSVALNAAGDRLAVGAPFESGFGNAAEGSGAVYLFSFANTDFVGGALRGVIGKGYSGGKDVDVTALEMQDIFGRSVALNAAGDRLAVGAVWDDGVDNAASDAGAVYLFSFTDGNFSGGTLEATLGKGYAGGRNVDVTVLEANDNFGISVALNAAGDRLAVGAREDDGAGNGAGDSGAVHLFSFTDGNFSGGSLTATIGAGYTGGRNVDVTALEAGDFFGQSVALNAAGNRLAVGARFDDGAGNAVSDSGAVYLFSFTDNSFTGGTLEATIGAGYTGGKDRDVTALGAEDRFGESVALNAAGDRLAVGAVLDDGAGPAVVNSGAVYLFSFSDTNFSGGALTATLGKGYAGGSNVDVAALEALDYFGQSVALNAAGDRLAVGASGDDGVLNAASNSGAVYLFSFSDTNFSGGTLEATLGAGYTGGWNVDVTALEAGDQFGASVALNAAGDRLAVGASIDAGAGNAVSEAGAVYLFSFTDTNFSSGTLEATMGAGYTRGNDIDVTALEGGDWFGASVALNAAGDRLAVGAILDDGAGNAVNGAGAVYLFSFTDGNFSGGALTATIGKGYTGGKNIDLTALEQADALGFSVALNAAGDRLAVGTDYDDGAGNAVTSSGAVYLFSFTDGNFSGGVLTATIGKGYTGGRNVDVAALEVNDRFGISVALNAAGDRLAVGAVGDEGAGNAAGLSGAVYLFSFTDTFFSGGALTATMGAGYTGGRNVDVTALELGDSFGFSVALNAAGDRLAVSAGSDDGAGNAMTNAGAVHLFSFSDTNFSGGALTATIGAGYTGGRNVDVTALEASDQFGKSVALNAAGDRLAVGAVFDDGAGNAVNAAGAVYLFSFTDTNFSGGALEATFGTGYTGGRNVDVSTLDAIDNFGYSVALNAAGDRLAVGAGLDDGFNNAVGGSGAVYLFTGSSDPLAANTSFADNPSDTATVAAADIVALLGRGTAVTLQASNDITVAEAVTVTGTPSSIGGLTLQAGRSILVNADITTAAGSAGGDVTLIANDRLASGVVDAERDAGAAVIAMANGTAIDAGPGAVSLELRDGAGKTNRASGDITVGDITASTISIVNDGPTTGSGVVLDTGAVLTAGAGSGTSIDIAGDSFTNNAGAGALVTSGSGRFLVWSGDPAADDRGGIVHDFKQYNATRGSTAVAGGAAQDGFLYTLAPIVTPGLTGLVSKTYDATDAATLAAGNYTVSGAVDGDTVTLNNPTSGTYDDKNAGTGKTVTATGISIAGASNGGVTVYGYQLASTGASGAVGAIDAAFLSLTGVSAANKVYDATTTAVLSGGTLSGVIGGDMVTLNAGGATGAFADRNVGTGKSVTASGFALSGADAGNYILTQPTGLTADITAATLTLTGVSAANKVYDATTTAVLSGGTLAGVIGGDMVTLNAGGATGAFADRNVGTGKSVTASGYAISGADAGNYVLSQPTGLTADITAATLTVSGTFTASDKVYDGATTASIDTAGLSLSGVLGADDVSLNTTGATGAFADRNVGTGKTVTLSGGALTGVDAGNYVIGGAAPTTTADITAATLTLTGVTAANKVYDATTTAVLSGGTLAGVIGGDMVTLNAGGATGAFADRNVGTGKAVTASGYAISGADAGNYVLSQPTGLTADITAATLTLTGVSAANKVYNATTTAVLSGGTLSGVIGGDMVTLNSTSASGAFADKNVGTGKSVTASGFALSGADAGNYVLSQPTGLTADITAATLTVSGTFTASNKVYDGATTASIDTAGLSLSGVLGADDVSLNTTGATGAFADRNVGTGKTVTLSGGALTGVDAGNYVIGGAAPTTTADITAATLTLTGVTAANKVYDATTAAVLSGGTLSGVIVGDMVTLNSISASGVFADRNVGTGKSVTASGFALSGADAGNYVLTQPTGLTADITAATLTLTGVSAANKVYNATTTAILSGGTLSGLFSGDMVTLNSGSASGVFADRNVGTGKSVTASGFALSGADAGNYVLSQPTGLTADITAATLTLTGVSAANKVYDATTTAILSGGTLAGVIGGDLVTLNAGGATGAFADRNVGTGKAVTASGYALSGADAGNYVLSQPTGLTADITAATLTLTGVSAANKVYDATTTAVLSGGTLSGLFSGDMVTLNSTSASGAFADRNVGTAKTVTASGFALSGADAGNYVLTQPTGLTADITAATLTVRVDDASRRLNDPNPAFTFGISGFVGGEDASLVSGLTTGTDARPDSPVGTYRIFASGGSAQNYEFVYFDGVLTVLSASAGKDPVGRDLVGSAEDSIIHADPRGADRGADDDGRCLLGRGPESDPSLCSFATAADGSMIAVPSGTGERHWTGRPGDGGDFEYVRVSPQTHIRDSDSVYYVGYGE